VVARYLSPVDRGRFNGIVGDSQGEAQVSDIRTPAVLEIRTYLLKPGSVSRMQGLLDGEVGALLREHGLRVVYHGPSLAVHDEQSYVLIRVFESLAQRDEQEDRFYGSETWGEQYREEVLAMIESYQEAVIEVDASVAEGLWRSNAS
jgi:hypothetical protein